jgi:phosphoribosylanthranilate isomerase
MTRAKICGLTRPEDIEIVNKYKPDYIGFVFAQSRRRVTPEQALNLRKNLSSKIAVVGVFVNEPPEYMQALVRNGVIDIIQTPTHVGEYLIFDSPNPGSGVVFDWETIPALLKHSTAQGELRTQALRFFLAGGLNPSNVAEAIMRVKPFAVDVSSGVEVDGVKDAGKIHEFLRVVRTKM